VNVTVPAVTSAVIIRSAASHVYSVRPVGVATDVRFPAESCWYDVIDPPAFAVFRRFARSYVKVVSIMTPLE